MIREHRPMDVRRLHLLLELSRLGSMREVAETHGLTTSTVSQQLAALAREVRTPLVEPDGRRVRLTPAGRRLADHAVTILAAVDAARLDLDPDAEPAGTLRVGGFATAIRSSLMPVIAELAASHPQVHVLVREYEPIEAFHLLADDDLDLALTYDYNLAPASPAATLASVPLWTTAWGLGVPSAGTVPASGTGTGAGSGPGARPTWPRGVSTPGSSTPATLPTRTPCGPSARSPASRHGSATRSTASTSSRT